MKMVKAVVAVCGLLLLAGCDSGGSVSGGNSTIVSYKVECSAGVECGNATDINNYVSGDTPALNCVWHCATYNGQPNLYVSLDFKKNEGSCWELVSEYVTDGKCIGFSARGI